MRTQEAQTQRRSQPTLFYLCIRAQATNRQCTTPRNGRWHCTNMRHTCAAGPIGTGLRPCTGQTNVAGLLPYEQTYAASSSTCQDTVRPSTLFCCNLTAIGFVHGRDCKQTGRSSCATTEGQLQYSENFSADPKPATGRRNMGQALTSIWTPRGYPLIHSLRALSSARCLTARKCWVLGLPQRMKMHRPGQHKPAILFQTGQTPGTADNFSLCGTQRHAYAAAARPSVCATQPRRTHHYCKTAAQDPRDCKQLDAPGRYLPTA
jgi:hypothetical protein